MILSRSHQELLIDWRLLVRAYLFLALLEAAASITIYFLVLHSGAWHCGKSLDSG